MSVEQKKQVDDSSKSVLKALREQSGLSQEQFAVALGVGSATLRRWENEEKEPSMTKIQWETFCSLVNVPFDQLPSRLSVPIAASV
ncbi:HTH containing protein [Cylindrospermum sp. NIES-4074]|nr:HTH containing protein [Cylindrospermum sp. NIES-4074]